MQFHLLTVKDIQQEANQTVTIAFDIRDSLKKDFSFIPGQYITIKKRINGEEVRRSYSICSAPHEGELIVAVKKITEGRFSTFANEVLRVGDTLEVMPPMGSFHVDYDAEGAKKYVAFVAGSGITPVMSIMKHVLHTDADSTFNLFYGNRTEGDVIFKSEIDALATNYPERLQVHCIYSKEDDGHAFSIGRIDTKKLENWYDNAFAGDADTFLLCGPEEMIFTVKDFLESKGVTDEKIRFELFTAPTAGDKIKDQPKEDIQAHITAIVDDDPFDFELNRLGKSLLDAGIEAGVDLPFSCKGGVCSTCKAKILEGSAEMKLNYSLLDEEVEAGYILTCQSHPTSETLVVSFDE